MPDEPLFHVFLCHNSRDKPAVREIARQLEADGLSVWLDEEQLRPGFPWQRALEAAIGKIRAAAVFVGSAGIGPWQEEEIEAYLRQFVRRKCPVIPVLLPGATEPKLPVFLEGRTWVDWGADPERARANLRWGITGDRTARRALPQLAAGYYFNVPRLLRCFENFDIPFASARLLEESGFLASGATSLRPAEALQVVGDLERCSSQLLDRVGRIELADLVRRVVVRQSFNTGRFIFFSRGFYCKGSLTPGDVTKSSTRMISMHETMSAEGATVRVEMTIDPRYIASDTGFVQLSGRSSHRGFGMFLGSSSSEDAVEVAYIRPLVIGCLDRVNL